MATAFLWLGEGSERSRVLRHYFGIGSVVDELPLSFALDQASIGKNFQVMGDGGWCDAPQGNQFAAVHGDR